MTEPFFILLMRLVTGIVLGGILGSFITMLVYRLPRSKSLITPGSSCPSCRKVIGWPDLVPVYSYWKLKGKCRHCGKPFGQRYLIIEIVSVVAVTLAFLIYGFGAEALVVIFIFLIVCTLWNILERQGKGD